LRDGLQGVASGQVNDTARAPEPLIRAIACLHALRGAAMRVSAWRAAHASVDDFLIANDCAEKISEKKVEVTDTTRHDKINILTVQLPTRTIKFREVGGVMEIENEEI
jgi:hypothetical protein